jgi:hypothetical protein
VTRESSGRFDPDVEAAIERIRDLRQTTELLGRAPETLRRLTSLAGAGTERGEGDDPS